MSISRGLLERLTARRENLLEEAEAWMRSLGEGPLSPVAAARYRQYVSDIEAISESVRDTRAELDRMGSHRITGTGGDAMSYGRQWAAQVAEKLHRMSGSGAEKRAVVSGSIDIPSLVEAEVIPIARPLRLIDLFSNRVSIEGNAFEYYTQTIRDNNAAPVPDNALKPTSILTVAPVVDRARVIAHLSEPTPIRLWDDHSELQNWLTSEMLNGVLDALEYQVISGDGTGENFTGILNAPGTTQVPYDTDAITTLRGAITALQSVGEVPSGWALHPSDAQEIDLGRWGTQGGFLTGGFESGGDPSSANIFGPNAKRVVSTSVPPGTAILGDWTKCRIYVRQDTTLALDASGELFTRNQFLARCEGRYGLGLLRPSAFAIVDLTAA